MSDLYPIYIILFANNKTFSKMIQGVTKSSYSHASISLDPSLNNMYSFSAIPYTKSISFITQPSSLVRESVYGPMMASNSYFTVLITFVNKDGYDKIKEKINFFIKNHEKYRYNRLGIIQYFLNFRSTKIPDEEKKKKMVL